MFKRNCLNLVLSTTLLMISTSLSADTATTNTPAGAVDTKENSNPEIDIKKLSEAFGHFIGKNIKTSGLNFDVPSLIQGIRNGSEGKPSPLSDKEYEAGMLALQQKTISRLTEENLNAAEKFLSENASKTGVVSIEPGKLQYLIIDNGAGTEVKEHGTPQINYSGAYIDGTVFGSSKDAGGPITLPLDQTIPGFSKAIVGMKEGEKRRIFVHPDLGYGTSGQLPPNSLLIFEVEVLKADTPKTNGAAKIDEGDEDDETPPLSQLDINSSKFGSKMSAMADNGQKAASYQDDEEDEDDYLDMDDDYDDEDDLEDERDLDPAASTQPVKK